MPLRPVPWAIGNGAENSVELARASHSAATSGNTGITEPSDFRVTALPTPGAAVRASKGGGTIKSTYPGVFGQSYAVQEQSYTDIPVAATGSSAGATKYVYVLITDTQYGGQNPPSVENGPYNDYAVTTTLPANQPYLLLAKIDQPKSTATITNAMITDLREVANPLVLPVTRANPLNLSEAETLTSTTTGERFPNAGGRQDIDIPAWATRVILEAEWLQVNEPAGNAYGWCWIEWGPLKAGDTTEREYGSQRYRWNTGASNDSERKSWKAADDMYIPAAMRGTNQIFSMRARLGYASNNAARPQLDQYSGTVLKATFLQVADKSTS